MKNPCEYTLGEIEIMLTMNEYDDKKSMDFFLDSLYDFVKTIQVRQQNYQVQKAVEQIRAPRELSKRKCTSIEADVFNACILVNE